MERYYVTIAHQLFLNFKLFTYPKTKYISSYNHYFWVYMQTLINPKRKMYSIKVFTFKNSLKLNAAFSAE